MAPWKRGYKMDTMENQFWNTMRARNFMKYLKLKNVGFENNIAVLANTAMISVAEFMHTDPISYGIMVIGIDSHDEIKMILGRHNYNDMYAYYSNVAERKRLEHEDYLANKEYYDELIPAAVTYVESVADVAAANEAMIEAAENLLELARY